MAGKTYLAHAQPSKKLSHLYVSCQIFNAINIIRNEQNSRCIAHISDTFFNESHRIRISIASRFVLKGPVCNRINMFKHEKMTGILPTTFAFSTMKIIAFVFKFVVSDRSVQADPWVQHSVDYCLYLGSKKILNMATKSAC